MRKLLLLGMILLMAGSARAQISGAGNVGCPGITVTGTVANSGTSNNTVLATVAATPCPAVLVQLDQTTTLTVGAITFNLSNDLGTNYTAVPVAQVLNQSTFVQLTNPYTVVANTNQAFLIILNGATYFQVKLTTAITGSGAVTPYVTPVGLPPALALDASGNVKMNISAQTLGKVLVTPDSVALPANQSTNIAQFGGSATVTGTGASGSGIPRVTVSNDSSLAANQSVNVAQVNGNTTVTAATGVQKVGVTGNAAVALDAVIGASAPANVLAEGLKDTAGNAEAALSDVTGRQIVKTYPDTTTTSYHASTTVASAASATDIAVMPGNATNTAIITRVIVSCTQTTAGIITLNLIQRNTADTAGTSSAMTAVKDDQNYAAAVSAPLKYTANPTVNSTIGNIDTLDVGCMATGTASPNDVYVFRPPKPIVERGTAQQLAVNLGGVTVTGSSFTITFEWMETTTP
jgi:hypothetical protein